MFKIRIAAVAMLLTLILAAAAGCGDPAHMPVASGLMDGKEPAAEAGSEAEADTAIASPAEETIGNMKKAAESNELALYVDEETTEIAVLDKTSGMLWQSNPADKQNDSVASDKNKDRLYSQLVLNYYDDKGQSFFMDNYSFSVGAKEFKINPIKGGIEIVYTMGNNKKGSDNIPKVVDKKRFEEKILNKLNDSFRDATLKYYHYNKADDTYVREPMNELGVRFMLKVLKKVGYTAEDLAIDNKGREDNANGGDKPKFEITVQYTVNQDKFVVNIPAGRIKQSGKYKLYQLDVLPMFGAAGKDKEGYLFIPDGSGALVYLNNNKTYAQPVKLQMYGYDKTLKLEDRPQQGETARLPVFGMKQNDQAFIAIIEEGDALANVQAQTSGMTDSYNAVSSGYTLMQKGKIDLRMGEKSQSLDTFQSKLYEGDIRIRYRFLSGQDADYTGMARYYRDYLVDRYNLTKQPAGKDMPFIADFIGSIVRPKSFLGIPYESVTPLTSYDQAIELLEMLRKEQITNVKLKVEGWFNGDIRHDTPDTIELNGSMGGRKSFERLVGYAKEHGVSLYPDVSFLRLYHGSGGMAAYNLDRDVQKDYLMDPITEKRGQFSHYVLSPRYLPGIVDSFIGEAETIGLPGLSLRDLADEINSDFDLDDTIDRQTSLQLSRQTIRKLDDRLGHLMAGGGNAYAIPYAEAMVDVPLQSSGYNIVDEDVPFYAMVLHGYVDFAGKPFNYLQNSQLNRVYLLKSLESGALPYYSWFYESSELLKYTNYTDLYASDYRDSFDHAVKTYKEMNEFEKKIRGQTIASHRKLADRVYETVFENGVSIIVNYNEAPATLDGGISVDPFGYKVGDSR